MKNIILLSGIILVIGLFSLSSANVAEAAVSINNTTGGGIAQGVLDASADDGYLNLANGIYTGSNNTNIIINSNITISGSSQNGTIIDANSSGRIFNVTAGNRLTLYRITIMNGNVGTNNYGGAIYSTGLLTLNYITFINNTAGRGGAVWAQNPENSTISNNFGFINFVNNRATDGSAAGGGALMLTGGQFQISYSNFTNNTANYNGGAINKNNGTIIGVSNCNFENNTARYSGGAIYNTNSNLTITSTTFINNSANTTSGGAIYSNTATATTITRGNFYNNHAASQGGAIYVRHTLSSTGSNYINNTALEGGGIYSYPDTGDVLVQYNRFVNNSNFDFYLNNTSISSKIPNLDYNWWGDNSPLVYGVDLTNWFVMVLSIDNPFETTINAIENRTIGNYTLTYQFLLWNVTLGDFQNVSYGILPYFSVNITWKDQNGNILYNLTNVGATGEYSYIVNLPRRGNVTIEAMGDLEDFSLLIQAEDFIGQVNLSLKKTVNVTGDVLIGQTITYKITATNNGPYDTYNVVVTELLPNSLILLSSSHTLGSFDPITGLWEIGTLANGETAELIITVQVNATGLITNIANITTDDINIGNNQVNFTINAVRLQTKTTINVPNTVKLGETINISGVATDEHDNPLANTVLDVIIDGKAFTVRTDSNGQWNLHYTPVETGKIEVKVSWDGNIIDSGFVKSASFNVIKEDDDNGTNPDNPKNPKKPSNPSKPTNPNNIAQSTMKKTGNPFVPVMILLIFYIGLLGYRRISK